MKSMDKERTTLEVPAVVKDAAHDRTMQIVRDSIKALDYNKTREKVEKVFAGKEIEKKFREELKLSYRKEKAREISMDPKVLQKLEKDRIIYRDKELTYRIENRELERKVAKEAVREMMRNNPEYSEKQRTEMFKILERKVEETIRRDEMYRALEEKLNPKRYYVAACADIDGDGFADLICVDLNGGRAAVMGVALTDRFDELEIEKENLEKAQEYVDKFGKRYEVVKEMVYDGDEGLTPGGVTCLNYDSIMNSPEPVAAIFVKTDRQLEREEKTCDNPFEAACTAAIAKADQKREQNENVSRAETKTRDENVRERVAPWCS